MYIDIVECYAPPIARYLFKFNVTGKFQQTVWPRIHFVLNLRYNTFQQFMIDHWENPCDFFNRSGNTPVLDVIHKNFGHLLLWHACPIRPNDSFIIFDEEFCADDYSIDPEFPAGKYRFDITFSARDESFFILKFYFTLSELEKW